jgi:hypothetical protein
MNNNCCNCQCDDLGCFLYCQNIKLFDVKTLNPLRASRTETVTIVLKYVPTGNAKVLKLEVVEGEGIEIPYDHVQGVGQSIIEVYDSSGFPYVFEGTKTHCFLIRTMPAVYERSL